MAADREAKAKARRTGRGDRGAAAKGDAPPPSGPAPEEGEAGEAKRLFACRRFD